MSDAARIRLTVFTADASACALYFCAKFFVTVFCQCVKSLFAIVCVCIVHLSYVSRQDLRIMWSGYSIKYHKGVYRDDAIHLKSNFDVFNSIYGERKIAWPQRFKLNVFKLRRQIMTPNEWKWNKQHCHFCCTPLPILRLQLTHPLGERNGRRRVRGENSPTASSYYFVFLLWNLHLISLQILCGTRGGNLSNRKDGVFVHGASTMGNYAASFEKPILCVEWAMLSDLMHTVPCNWLNCFARIMQNSINRILWTLYVFSTPRDIILRVRDEKLNLII